MKIGVNKRDQKVVTRTSKKSKQICYPKKSDKNKTMYEVLDSNDNHENIPNNIETTTKNKNAEEHEYDSLLPVSILIKIIHGNPKFTFGMHIYFFHQVPK